VGFGWAKPVPVNPHAFRNPRRGEILVAAAGPASNVFLAIVAAILLRLMIMSPIGGNLGGAVVTLLISIASVNLYLAFFNLIPIPPLDGSRILSALLPVRYAAKYEAVEKYGMTVVFALIVIGGLIGFSFMSMIVVPPARLILSLLLGVGF